MARARIGILRNALPFRSLERGKNLGSRYRDINFELA